MTGRKTIVFVCLSFVFFLSGCGASPIPKAPAWNGKAVFSRLSRLGNFSFNAVFFEAYDYQALLQTESGAFHNGADYSLALSLKSASFTWPEADHLIHAGGQDYLYLLKVPAGAGVRTGWLALGPSPAADYQGTVQDFQLIFQYWSQRLSGTKGSYVGPCQVLGRNGDLYQVLLPLPSNLKTGPVKAAVCVDARTGAPLNASATLHTKQPSGQPIDVTDRFDVTDIGSVPVIAAPSGAEVAPATFPLP